ncbi:VWA domain-containing protein [Planktothrix sp. FACHB-1355]|uniref:VWA domain-containing protein n=1 Tax=Aerosakkonema funiforme FACHB-1375 TaxID=2949571 RepID=A0A926VD07_9CYAN|nr:MULTISPECIES: VWA domain-containing protein [Oscillatoriales]MBD2181275.1 VWA domain-containing protein [Aerosakkonema funiforme FACHB-1375]MBD3558818.1 VWA domain-containing protein [Planktothrix sp. FACHB-1355]
MKANYSLSNSLIAVNSPSVLDLIINFGSEDETQNQAPRRPLNLSLAIDRSSSMAGQSLRYAIQAAQNVVDRLAPDDILSVVIYDDNAETIIQPQRVEQKATIRTQIGKIKAGGCTNLHGGWLMACDLVKSRQSTEKINRVLLLTDGLANVGISDSPTLINHARQQAEQGIITTTLGFGNGFNEDLLIGMANAAGGNFYFIQSPDDATDVFRIELESLTSVVAQNLTVMLQLETAVQSTAIINKYRSTFSDKKIEVFLGDVYGVENKPLAVELSLAPFSDIGVQKVVTVSYKYQTVVDGNIQEVSDEIPINITVGTAEEANSVQPDAAVVEQASKLKIAKVKDEAIALADKGDYTTASQKLRKTIEDLKLKSLHETFEVAEEIDQLDHYAQSIENRRFDNTIRKEMRDQSYQALTRDRGDLKLRGLAGSASSLQAVSSVDQGVLVQCFRESGKLRIRVISDGYNQDFNVQFPRNIREEGVTYIVDEINLSADGSFYRASGNIRRLVKPGEERAASQYNTSTAKTPKRQKLNAPTSAADLETTDSIGDGVLVQCVKEGSKLRARVVSDGYNPNWNIRFPRDIREENVLYVVDEVEEAKNGGSYVAYGKIKRLVQ